MEATSSTEDAPPEDLGQAEPPNGEGIPVNYQDATVDTSDVEGMMVATNGNRERIQEEVVEVLGVMLPRVFPMTSPLCSRPQPMHPTPPERDSKGFRGGRTWMLLPTPQETRRKIRSWGQKEESLGFRAQVLFRGCS